MAPYECREIDGPEREAEVLKVLRVMENSVSSVISFSVQLSDRLERVLRPEPPKNGDQCSVVPAYAAPLAQRIAALDGEVTSISLRLQSLLDRLEI